MCVTVVVGGTRGIGKVIAEQLSARGDDVYTMSRRELNLDTHISFDLSSEDFDSLTQLLEVDIDYLVFAQRYRGSEWNQQFAVMVRGIEGTLKALQSRLKDNASVVILSSQASQSVFDDQPAHYHSSRASLEALARYYAVDYGKRGIRCNCVLPATVVKPENSMAFANNSGLRSRIEQITPLGRVGTAQDIANVVEFLCSDKSSFITGSSFLVDGGLSLISQESLARTLLGSPTGN